MRATTLCLPLICAATLVASGMVSAQTANPILIEPLQAPSSRVTTPIKVDKDHPLRIGEEYYPEESKRLGEQGICVVRVQVSVDGRIRASIGQSTGYDALDQACLRAVEHAQFVAAQYPGGVTFAAETDIHISWRLP